MLSTDALSALVSHCFSIIFLLYNLIIVHLHFKASILYTVLCLYNWPSTLSVCTLVWSERYKKVDILAYAKPLPSLLGIRPLLVQKWPKISVTVFNGANMKLDCTKCISKLHGTWNEIGTPLYMYKRYTVGTFVCNCTHSLACPQTYRLLLSCVEVTVCLCLSASW